MSRPNIVFFFVDQQRWDTCGCYGQRLPVTPVLDAMAAEGVRFEHAFTCQPVCGPARAALQSGRYASEVGCNTNHQMLPTDIPTIAKLLTGAGYDTAYIGKWHLASFGPRNGADDFTRSAVPPERRGGYRYWLAADALEHTSHGYDGHMFDGDGNQRDFPDGRYRADAQTDWALEYLDSRKAAQDQPFFLMVSYLEPHHQNDHNHYEGPQGSKERWKNFDPPADLIGHDGDWRAEYPDYLGCCNSLDENLGRIRGKLEEMGVAGNTVIIYTSDHGSHFRTRNTEYKRSCHDGCLRVPLVASGPGFAAGTVVSDKPVNLIDVPATILQAAGVEVPEFFRGRPLQQAADGSAKDWPQETFAEISESHVGRCLRTMRYTYEIVLTQAGQPHWREAFLYDNLNDPHQQNNLIREPLLAEVRRDLWRRLARIMIANGDQKPCLETA